MIPEVTSKRRLEIWKCLDFPGTWTLCKTYFEGRAFGDPTILFSKKYGNWLFVNESDDKFGDYNSTLNLFRIDDIDSFTLTPHKLNPVVLDSREARSAGDFFEDEAGRLIRPVQNNIKNIYGHGLLLCQIVELTIDTYEQVVIERIKPKFKDGIIGVHHLSLGDNKFVVDACYKVR